MHNLLLVIALSLVSFSARGTECEACRADGLHQVEKCGKEPIEFTREQCLYDFGVKAVACSRICGEPAPQTSESVKLFTEAFLKDETVTVFYKTIWQTRLVPGRSAVDGPDRCVQVPLAKANFHLIWGGKSSYSWSGAALARACDPSVSPSNAGARLAINSTPVCEAATENYCRGFQIPLLRDALSKHPLVAFHVLSGADHLLLFRVSPTDPQEIEMSEVAPWRWVTVPSAEPKRR